MREEDVGNETKNDVKTKVKTRKERDDDMLAKEEAGIFESSMDDDTQEEGSPLDGHIFRVTKRVYETFEQYLGSGVGGSR